MSFTRLLFLLTSLLFTLCSRSRSFPLFPPLFFFPFTPALSSLAGGLVGAGWYGWICEYGDFAWLLGVAECVANSGCCISLVAVNSCSNLDTDAASGLHSSPAVGGVSHAASTQHKAVSTKQLNMLEAGCDDGDDAISAAPFTCSVLLCWYRKNVLSCALVVTVCIPYECIFFSLWLFQVADFSN